MELTLRSSAVIAAGGGGQFMPLLALTLLATVLLTLLLRRFRLPALPGYFLCGFLLARLSPVPMGEGTEAAALLGEMADVGILLLMFTVGAECSRHELQQLRKRGVRAAAEDAGDKACRAAAARQHLSPPASKMWTAGSDKALVGSY